MMGADVDCRAAQGAYVTPASEATMLQQVLGLPQPWHVVAVQEASGGTVLTVRIESRSPSRGLFGRRSQPPLRRQLRWEHLPLAGRRCQLVVGLREGETLPAAPWVGEHVDGYTRALNRWLVDALIAGATLEQLALLLGLPYADLWRFKFRLDQSKGEAVPAATAHAMATPPTGARAALPGPHAPVWAELLHGRVPLEVRSLSLRLLLSKLQREARLHGDTDLHTHAATQLHQYFARNAAALGFEAAQVSTWHAPRPAHVAAPHRPPPTVAATPNSGLDAAVPDVSDPVWMALLHGQRDLEVRTFGLKLLLARLRAQIVQIRDDDARMIKLVELHRYFDRNRAHLGHEIGQLQRWSRH